MENSINKSEKKVSIGLLTYKRTDLLLATIKDIVTSKYKIDLIIVNNNEDINIIDELDFIKNHPNIHLKYIWDKKNYGVSIGRNKIIEKVTTPFLIILDDDVAIPSIDIIIEECILCFETDKTVGGIAFHIKDIYTKKANRYEIPHKNKVINLEQDFDTYLFIGAGHALRMDLISKISPYPNDFGLYAMEEIDLSFRIIGFGYKIRFLSKCEIYHKRSPEGRHHNHNIYYLSYINRVKISLRYLKLRYIISCILVRGLYMLYYTKSIHLLWKAIKEIKQEFRVSNKNNKFNDNFYLYIKKVRGFIWW